MGMIMPDDGERACPQFPLHANAQTGIDFKGPLRIGGDVFCRLKAQNLTVVAGPTAADQQAARLLRIGGFGQIRNPLQIPFGKDQH